jgi:hypothetical protein
MEEGEFSINKYGINAKIKSPTTILASSNPFGNSNWNDDEIIDIDEIPALKPVLDRFDLIFIFRSLKNEDAIREYAFKMADLESSKIPNYSSYLVKHLEYAKTFNPIMDDEAKNMLTEFFTKIRVQGFGSNRVLNTLYRLSKAIARLKLKNIVDEEDAKDVMSFYNVMLQNFQKAVNVSTSPKDVAYNEFIRILQSTESGVTIQELCKLATDNNGQVDAYLGGNWSTKYNKKLRRVIEEISNNTNVKKIGSHPIVLKWLSDHSDHSDLGNLEQNSKKSDSPSKIDQTKNLISQNEGAPRSLWSPSNGHSQSSNSTTLQKYPPSCYYCNQMFLGTGKQAYENHIIQKHPGKPGYPGHADIEFYKLCRKGMEWEK